MKFAVAILSVGLAAASAARADTIPVAFSGVVDDGSVLGETPTAPYAGGQTVSGSFVFDTATDTFTSFQIGGISLAAGATSLYSPPLTSTYLAYLGVQTTDPSTMQQTGELELNFYYENALPSTVDIASFIENPGDFSQDVSGGSPSYFSVFEAGGPAFNVLLTTYAAPEPASLALVGAGLAGLVLVRRRAA